MVSVAWLKNAKKVLKYNIIGVALCILAMVPFFGGAIIFGENDLIMVNLFSLTLVIIGIAVILFIKVGIIMESYNKLLQEGEYTKVKKERSPLVGVVTTVYWLVTRAIYLALVLPNENYSEYRIVWVIATVLYPAVLAIINLFIKKK